jgi:hypothetical protein
VDGSIANASADSAWTRFAAAEETVTAASQFPSTESILAEATFAGNTKSTDFRL